MTVNFVSSQPLPKAIESFGKRTPIGTALRSAEMERMPQDIKDRAFWSATLESEKLAQAMRDRIAQRLALARSEMADGSEGVIMDRRRFIDEMRVELAREGYQPEEGLEDTLQDFTSTRRLALIWDMNLAQAQGAAMWAMDTSRAALLMRPAMEFVRLEKRDAPRDWPMRWAAAGGKFYPGESEYPEGRMIALVTDPIWVELNRFDVPWKPFDWGSGMGTVPVRRREAIELGVMGADDPVQVPQQARVSESLRSSAKGLTEAGRERLRSELGDSIKFDDEDAIYEYATSDESSELKTISERLRERASSYYRRGEEALAASRQENDGAEALYGSAEKDQVRQGWLAQIAAVATGRKRLFHSKISAKLGKVLRDALWKIMPQVEFEVDEDGHFVAWRMDVLKMAPSRLLALCRDPARHGFLLGYGKESLEPGVPHTKVILLDAQERVVGGFHAPVLDYMPYAKARLRDFTDALGDGYKIKVIKWGGEA